MYFEVFGYQLNKDCHFFERCVADGGRDYGARLITVPIISQVI